MSLPGGQRGVKVRGCAQRARIAECGPGKVLAGLVKRIDKSVDARALGTPSDFDAALAAWQ